MKKRNTRFTLTAGLLAALLCSVTTASWAGDGLMRELSHKAMRGQSYSQDRHHERRDHDRKSYKQREHRKEHRRHDRDHRRYAYDDHRHKYYGKHHRKEHKRHVTRYYDTYVTHHHSYRDNDDDVLLGLVLGGLVGYAIGNAEPAYIYDYDR
jgi:hypothetical protein